MAEQLNFAFRCAWVGGDPCAGDECVDAGWFSRDQALRLVRAPQQAGKLRDALSDAPGVGYRSYRTCPYEVSYESRC